MLGELRWLLRKAVAAFGDLRVSELSSQESSVADDDLRAQRQGRDP
jgi:hypothetical protein